VPIAVLVSFAQVIAQLTDGLLHRYFAILIRPFDVPERDHLYQCFVRRHGIQPRMRRMSAIGAGNLFPDLRFTCETAFGVWESM
jgi:hypothetical protein